MAGLGLKTFASAEVLTAANVQGYLMDQSVMVFASSAARGSAIAAPTEGMHSYLSDTDSTEVYDGSAWAAVAGGKILQVVSTAKADTFTYTGSSFGEVTGLTVTITPSSASSTVLLMASVSGQRNVSNSAVGQFTIYRGASNLIAPTSPGSRNATFSSGVQVGDTNGSANMETYNYTYLDSPATTSATTYAVRVRNSGGAEVTYVNRGEADSDSATQSRGVSTIMVMEVSA